MLYQFFITQWANPTRRDWTEKMKEDLEELRIPADFNFLKSKSKDIFKQLVKKKSRSMPLKISWKRKRKLKNGQCYL